MQIGRFSLFDTDDEVIISWTKELAGSIQDWELEKIKNEDELKDAFSKDLSFGTGGIRALMGIGPNRMNILTIGRVSQGLANYLLKTGHTGETVAIACDSRIHSSEFSEIAASVLSANGIRVALFPNATPTPLLSFGIRKMKCCAGVSITASHNPKEYNGFKVYGPTGDQATDALAQAIQTEIEQVDFNEVKRTDIDGGLDNGTIFWIPESISTAYLDEVCGQAHGIPLGSVKAIYSPLNGAGFNLASKLLDRVGANWEVVAEQKDPDGNFLTCQKPNPENDEAMRLGSKQLKESGADLFIANDPDADRLGVVAMHDGDAIKLSGDEVGLLLLDFISHVKQCEGAIAYTTIVSTPLADILARKRGFELRRTLTGFKYIGEQMDALEEDGHLGSFLFGFEESCGYLSGTHVRDKDGISSLLLVLECAAYHKQYGRDLVDALTGIYQELGFCMGRQISFELTGPAGRHAMASAMRAIRAQPYNVFEEAIHVTDVYDYSHGAHMPTSAISQADEDLPLLPPSNVIELRLEDDGKIILRPSGTEPKLKAYLFAIAQSGEEAKSQLDEMEIALRSRLAPHFEKKNDTSGKTAHVILLSGGSGSRLWPLSNSARSKQFLKVLRDSRGNHVSMVQRVFEQISSVDADVDITIATSSTQVDSLLMQVGGSFSLVVEPERRDTTAAILLACANLLFEQGASEDDPVVIMPIDTYAEQDYFNRIADISSAVSSGLYDIVLLGVEPTYPSEKYGYILPKDAKDADEVAPVDSFKEKPNEATAQKFIARGGLWNCGVFGLKLGYAIECLKRYYIPRSYEDLLENYSKLPKRSFDYEVVENSESIGCVRYRGVWKDLGTWNTLTEEMADEVAGRVKLDSTCSNVHAINETTLPLAIAGLNDAVVVATSDGILVSSKERSAHIKELVAEVSEPQPMYEEKHWGYYGFLPTLQSIEKGSPASRRVEEIAVHDGETAVLPVSGVTRVIVVVHGSGQIKLQDECAECVAGSSVSVPAWSECEITGTGLRLISVDVD